jgi:formylglycine-generating enzyme
MRQRERNGCPMSTVAMSSNSDMVCIPGGAFRMVSDGHCPREAPVHRAKVDSFWIDRTPVANRAFRKFVDATGHVAFVETAPDLNPSFGARRFTQFPPLVEFRIRRRSASPWWPKRREPRARRDHPVVHIAYRDAQACAARAGKELPTEAEWDPNYRRRGRPAARHVQPIDTSMSHVGFRWSPEGGEAHD